MQQSRTIVRCVQYAGVPIQRTEYTNLEEPEWNPNNLYVRPYTLKFLQSRSYSLYSRMGLQHSRLILAECKSKLWMAQ